MTVRFRPKWDIPAIAPFLGKPFRMLVPERKNVCIKASGLH